LFPKATPPPEVTPTPTPVATPTPIPPIPADWKTYTNTKLGYIIKFPKDWYFYEDMNMVSNKKLQPEQTVSPETQDKEFFGIKITIFDKEQSLSLDKWIDSGVWWPATEIAMEHPQPLFRETINLAGIEGKRLEYGTEQASAVYVFLEKEKSKVYQINSQLDSPGERDIFDQILSTFRFTD
jgi:hypothetical protein